MKERQDLRRNITPENFLPGLQVTEEQNAGALANEVDFRTNRVIANLPLRDDYNEVSLVECEVQLDDGAVFDSRYMNMNKSTGYYLSFEGLQLAREAAGRQPLTQQELDELKRQREETGFREVEIDYPSFRIPTRPVQLKARRKGVFAKVRDAFLKR